MKNKYRIAVAMVILATAISACGAEKNKMIPLDSVNLADNNDNSNFKSDNTLSSNSGNISDNNLNKNTGNNSNKNPGSNSNNNSGDASGKISDNTSNSKTVDNSDNTSNSNAVDNSDDNSGDNSKANKRIYVYICGAVLYPNVYEISSDARVVDVVNLAGGLTEDAAKEYVNLATTICDGQKILIPTYEEIESGEYKEVIATGNTEFNDKTMDNSEEKGGDSNTTAKVNINTASETELMTIPGVGQSKAGKIIAYRQENGGFDTIEDIMLITGIKEGMFNKIKDYITVD